MKTIRSSCVSLSLKFDRHFLISRTYTLEVVQQPETTAEFGNAALSRLPIAPPLFVQLIIRDLRGNIVEK